MGSSRLPGKPLADIGGRPMILHVRDRAVAAAIGPVVVACAEREIADAVERDGGIAVMTDPALASGTDRVQAACAVYDPERRFGVVINLQGDLPGIAPGDVGAVLRPLAAPVYDIATLVAPMISEADRLSPMSVKAACVFSGGAEVATAVYFSRACVPWGEGPLWHHLGIYAFRRAALDRFVGLAPGGLERREGLEQLRAIEAGMRIGCARIERAPFEVNTPDDLARARAALAA